MTAKLKIFLAVSIGSLLLDQISKIWVATSLRIGIDEVKIIPGFLSFVHAQNPFAAMGLGSVISDTTVRMGLFAGFTVVAMGILLKMLKDPPGEDRFQSQDVTVVLGANTGVTRAGSSTALTSKDPSVGQRIVAFGTSSTDAAGATTVDATAGRVRLEPTFIWGTFKSSGAGVATIGLEAIEGRAPTAFNFAGTGASTAQDADPANYEVNTRTLSLTGIAAGGVVKFGGYVNPFGAAPPDFDAQAMVDFSNVATELRVSWKDEGSSKPFATLAASGIVIDLANAELGLKSALRTGPKVTDIKSLASNPTLVGSTASGAPRRCAKRRR